MRAEPPVTLGRSSGVAVGAPSVVEHAVDQDFDQVQHVRPLQREELHLVDDPLRGRANGGRRVNRAPGLPNNSRQRYDEIGTTCSTGNVVRCTATCAPGKPLEIPRRMTPSGPGWRPSAS
jgi:hypothetical protein